MTRTLGGGGMGFVYLARDRSLDRVVAIKAIRPELATEAAVSRFLREARVLGRIRHPNIIPVHRAGMADGLPYYVMEYVEGETLAERIARRRMSEREAITTGRALLDALGAAHAAGVIHRDVKPANVFLTGSRVLLGDFGVARVDTTDPDATSTSGHIGTPAYMAPEQSAGGIVTEQSDVYAAAMVIYEMLTGRRWTPVADPRAADWAGVPHRYRHALRRALAWDPERRWNRATAFRRVLAPRYRLMRRITVSGWLVALLVVIVSLVVLWSRKRPSSAASATPEAPVQLEPADLAILPLRASPISDAAESESIDIAIAIDYRLSTISQLSLTPIGQVLRRWTRASEQERDAEGSMCRTVRAALCTGGTSRIKGDSLEYTLYVLDPNGIEVRRLGTLSAAGPGRIETLADTAARWLINVVHPGLKQTIRSNSELSKDLEARLAYFAAEHAVFSDRSDAALRLYTQALDLDPSFALARWRRTQAQRWQPGQRVDYRLDLERLAEAGPGRLDRVDSLLVQAQLQRPGKKRIEALHAVTLDNGAVASREALPWMLWGEELFHRGPLAGYRFDSASVGLFQAAQLDPLWPQPLQLLVWLHTRQGNESEAHRYLTALQTLSGGVEQGQYTEWLRVAVTERFDSGRAAGMRESLLTSSDRGELAEHMIRMPFAFDMPGVEEAYADHAIRMGRIDTRVTGFYGRFLAYAVRGQGRPALANLDSATTLMDSDTADLHAAEWRVIPMALGVPLFDDSVRDTGHDRLSSLARNPATRVRAAWALGLDAMRRRDTLGVRAWRDSLEAAGNDSTARRLRPMLDGILSAARGDTAGALAVTEPSLAWDAQGRHGDPFARSVLHLLRASWRTQPDDTTTAERDLRWAENLDITGWPAGQPQAVEVDWVLSVEASRRRGLLAIRRADYARACDHFRRVRHFWTDDITERIEPRLREVESKWAVNGCTQ
ncbi:MAG: serine/threonine-protein kinase [Gemmatimonadota bacterium]